MAAGLYYLGKNLLLFRIDATLIFKYFLNLICREMNAHCQIVQNTSRILWRLGRQRMQLGGWQACPALCPAWMDQLRAVHLLVSMHAGQSLGFGLSWWEKSGEEFVGGSRDVVWQVTGRLAKIAKGRLLAGLSILWGALGLSGCGSHQILGNFNLREYRNKETQCPVWSLPVTGSEGRQAGRKPWGTGLVLELSSGLRN